MYGGNWKLKCTGDIVISYMTFKAGHTYDVKDKFPGEDGTVETGDWEVKTGTGGLVYISKNLRDQYFIEVQ